MHLSGAFCLVLQSRSNHYAPSSQDKNHSEICNPSAKKYWGTGSYYQRVNRFDGRSPFTSQGAYAICRGLLTGGRYGYAVKPGALATPGKGSLEAVLMYSYTNLTDISAGIRGGRANDLSFTLNYYINRFMIARLHYGYTHVWDNSLGRRDMNGFMARLQVIF